MPSLKPPSQGTWRSWDPFWAYSIIMTASSLTSHPSCTHWTSYSRRRHLGNGPRSVWWPSRKPKRDLYPPRSLLVHYNSNLPIVLAGDAFAYGVGAVISHIIPDGREHPIAFASRTLSSTEQNYPQVEKEALSLIYGVPLLLVGRKFPLQTDNKLPYLGQRREFQPWQQLGYRGGQYS